MCDTKFTWYIRRLASMPFPEIGYRLRQQARITMDRVWLRRARSIVGGSEERELSFGLQDFKDIFNWTVGETDRNLHSTLFPENRAATFRVADKLCQNVFLIFGREINYDESIAWQRDPVTQHLWPSDFYKDIRIRDGNSIGGVKWIWELNRHHHLVTLGKAYFLSSEERYAREVCEQIIDWIDHNPPLIGVNWASPLEIAIRLINWTWALAFIRGSTALTQVVFGKILMSIALQAAHIDRHRSAYSSANNHLIGEAAGLAVVGLAFPDLPEAETWRQKGLSILGAEIEKQIHPDGVPAEQSLSYLLFILEFNLIAWELARRNGIDPDPRWQDRLDAASTFLASLLQGREQLPAIGDADDAYVLRLDDRPEASRAHSIIASAAAILDRADLKAVSPVWDEKNHWLLGEKGRRAYQSLGDYTLKPASRIFQDGGYAVLHSERAHILWDCGPLGYLSTAAHGHADALSFTLAVDGRPIFVDPGTFAYQEGGVWRDYFRSTSAHNTIVVDGRDQSEMLGDFLWGRQAKSTISGFSLGGELEWLLGKHNGYRALGIFHRRALFFWKTGALVVVDLLDGTGEVAVDQLWHLSEEVDLDLKDDHIEFRTPTTRVYAITNNEPQLSRKVLSGEQDPIQGWISPCYGVRKPAPVLTYSGIVQLPIRLTFTIFWGDMDLNAVQSITSRSLDKLESDGP